MDACINILSIDVSIGQVCARGFFLFVHKTNRTASIQRLEDLLIELSLVFILIEGVRIIKNAKIEVSEPARVITKNALFDFISGQWTNARR